jgi:hypothetical protein
MSDWDALGAMEIIVKCLPPETQRTIMGQLQLLAKVQADAGMINASYFTRALSGESPPTPKPKPRLVLVK